MKHRKNLFPAILALPLQENGIADDGKAVQCLLVRVNGQTHKPDGSPYHITLSIDPDIDVPEYNKGKPGKAKPMHSNIVAANAGFVTIFNPAQIVSLNMHAKFYANPAQPVVPADLLPESSSEMR